MIARSTLFLAQSSTFASFSTLFFRTTVDEGEGDDDDDDNDAYADYDDDDDHDHDRESIDPPYEDDSTNMPSPIPPVLAAGKTAVGKTAAATAKKKKDPTGVAGITQKLQAVSLKPQVLRFSFKAEFPFLLSPTGIFNDGMRRICLDFFGIPMHKNKYKVELEDGIIVKLFMRIPPSFVGHTRLESELANNLADRATIISAQRETSSLVFGIHGEADDIWSLPPIVALPFKWDNIFYVKQVWSNGDDDLFDEMTEDSMMNDGQVPDDSVHQMFLFQ